MKTIVSPQWSLRATTLLCWHYDYQTRWDNFKTWKTGAILKLSIFFLMSKVIFVQWTWNSGMMNVHLILNQRHSVLCHSLFYCSSHSLVLPCVSVSSGKNEHLLVGLNKPELSTGICNKELSWVHCQIHAFFSSLSLFIILRKWKTHLPVWSTFT